MLIEILDLFRSGLYSVGLECDPVDFFFSEYSYVKCFPKKVLQNDWTKLSTSKFKDTKKKYLKNSDQRPLKLHLSLNNNNLIEEYVIIRQNISKIVFAILYVKIIIPILLQ